MHGSELQAINVLHHLQSVYKDTKNHTKPFNDHKYYDYTIMPPY